MIAIINPVFDIDVDAQSHGTVKIICGVAAEHLVKFTQGSREREDREPARPSRLGLGGEMPGARA